MFNITKTKQEIAKEQFEEININSDSGTINLYNAYIGTYNLFWNNPNSTPQEIADVAGTQATQMFADHYETGIYLATKMKDFVPLSIPEKWEVVFNEDGTVTITEK